MTGLIPYQRTGYRMNAGKELKYKSRITDELLTKNLKTWALYD